MTPRYLTKSRFTIGSECPTKLFYTKKENYYDEKLEDEFLQSLAEGGFQVGELAKLYYPGGVDIEELDYDLSLARTKALLAKSEVILYEAAFLHEAFFIRTDLLIKKGHHIDLIEVKAKSFDPAKDSFLTPSGFIAPVWAHYLYDAAFQTFVVQKAYPSFQVSTHLLLADKTRAATVDGLNQKFLIYRSGGRKQVRVKGPVDRDSLGESILTLQNIDPIVTRIYQGTELKEKADLSFEEKIHFLADHYAKDQKIDSPLGSHCGSCEFKVGQEGWDKGLKSGFHECWKTKAFFTDADFQKPSVLQIWNFRKKDDYIRRGIYFQDQLTRKDFEPLKPSKQEGPGLRHWERQLLQVEKSAAGDESHYIDIPSLMDLEATWKYPYHFIDFETTAVAIPFNSGRKPYEAIAFQFSHHVLYQDGQIEHKGQWINAQPGVFPNFAFLRALKKELSQDDGTIFRYAAHENTILNALYRQLMASGEEDKTELCDWIRSVSHSGSDHPEVWEGDRDMVDLKEVIRQFYYHPLTHGSISIKQVLPAILSSCNYLKEKYSQPIYGKEIKSLNFTEQQWVRYSSDQSLINPYQLLPPLHEEMGNDSLDNVFTDDAAGIADGGAAMSAYAKMQFTEMAPAERERIVKALLKYCELDTFAMVLVWEGLAHWIHGGK